MVVTIHTALMQILTFFQDSTDTQDGLETNSNTVETVQNLSTTEQIEIIQESK